MRMPRPSPCPYHSWLGYVDRVPADESRVIIQRRRVAHCLIHVRAGRAVGHSVCRGRVQRIAATAGMMHFFPADGESHTLIGRHSPAHEVFTLLMRPSSFDQLAAADGVPLPIEPRSLVSFRDAELERCLAILAPLDAPGDAAPLRRQEAARRLVLRLVELLAGRRPEWHDDAVAFDPVTLANLSEAIEARLRIPPSLEEMAPLVGLSPSHFARKFRLATGMSLQRFVAHKRVQSSFAMLQADDTPLSRIALELGFASQSHFTNLFSEFTGMTPAKFRKQFRRVGGGRPR